MKKELLKFVVLLVVALGAAPAYSAYWQWSHVASQNANADPTIGWAEGMSPSSVNDSARAMMARSAEYRDDISGLLTTAGTSTAYTVTTNQGLCTETGETAPNDGQQLAITMNMANGDGATLTADGCDAAPIQMQPGVAMPAASLLNGNPYTLKYSVANTAWMVSGFFGSALSVPLGGMIPYTLNNTPNSNFVFPFGQCLSTTTYATYWTALGSPASGACPGGQFAIIDMRGRVPAAADNMGSGGGGAGRLTASSAGCGTSMNTVGSVCINGVEGYVTTLAQLPSGITSSGVNSISVNAQGSFPNIPVSNFGVLTSLIAPPGGTGNILPTASGGSWSSITSLSANNTISVTSNNTGNQAHPNVQPTIAVTYLLRVL